MSDELLLTLGAIVLLGAFIIASNTIILNNNDNISTNEYTLTAISIGQSLIDEAKLKPFDVVANPSSVGSLTLPGNLGPEEDVSSVSPDRFNQSIKSFISDTLFNDFDDYNGYQRIVNTPRLNNFKVRSVVAYADPSNPDPDHDSPSSTFCKMLKVFIWCPPYIDSTHALKMNYAYFYYN